MGKQKESSYRFVRSTKKIRLSDGVYARILRDGNMRPELAIILEDDTTAEQLRTAWGAISQAKQYLFDRIGTDMSDALTLLRFGKATMHLREGYSYSEIALEVNHDCLVHLCKAVIDFGNKDEEEALISIAHAKLQLMAMRMKEVDIDSLFMPALSEIREGHAPWTLTHGPVDKQRVRDALRQLEREMVSDKVKIVTPPKYELVPLKELKTYENPGLDVANALLNQEPDCGGLNKLNEAHRRVFSKKGEKPG